MTLTVSVTDEYTKGTLVVSPPGTVSVSAGRLVVLTPGSTQTVYVGTAPGESAFEVAVRNGFVGTEAEWLASLAGGGSFAHTHVQTEPLTTWTINHALPFRPSVAVVNTSGSTVIATVDYVSGSQIIVSHAAPVAGSAYLS